jgi:chromosome segregation ATPase
VRDEAVPQGGAELKCPSCGAVFVAHPPKHSEEEIATAVERITKAKDAAEARVGELERKVADADRRALEAEARVQQLEAQIIVLRSEIQGVQQDAMSRVGPLEGEVQRLRDEAARLAVRANAAQDAEMRILQMTEEVARARAAANHAPEVQRLTDELLSAQKTTGRLYTDLEVERQNAQRLEGEVLSLQQQLQHGAGKSNGTDIAMQLEVERLKDELARVSASLGATNPQGISPTLMNLVAAVGPMLWGLEQAIKYLEPYGASEAALASHVKQLQLLEKVLQRLSKESQQ